MDSERQASERLFSQLFNKLDVHDQIKILEYMDSLALEQERREKTIIDINDFQSQRKEKQ